MVFLVAWVWPKYDIEFVGLDRLFGVVAPFLFVPLLLPLLLGVWYQHFRKNRMFPKPGLDVSVFAKDTPFQTIWCCGAAFIAGGAGELLSYLGYGIALAGAILVAIGAGLLLGTAVTVRIFPRRFAA